MNTQGLRGPSQVSSIAEKRSELTNVSDQVMQEALLNDELVATLCARLETVVRRDPQSPNEKLAKDTIYSSEAATRLNQVVDKIKGTNDRIRYLLSVLEV